jgi:lipopolysaccharide transport system ATP-binding protein
MKPILEVQSVSKRFTIQQNGSPYLSFRDRVTGLFRKRLKNTDFWALEDISFSVDPGESLAIVGRNGAGKSTILKILSRITPPTTGRIISRGRVASLLEVGTGFHQELTGRENIFMNGSILGMRREEIKSRFDEIVAFSGVERFLDTQLKFYSSGMQLRLAFSVAAHLEPELLIIDEVLAVGDAEFQRKCLAKMGDVVGQGRTLIFVSHNLEVVARLCQKAVLLDKGKLISAGPSQEILSTYQQMITTSANSILSERTDRSGNGSLQFTELAVQDANGNSIQKVFSGQSVLFNIFFKTNQQLQLSNFQLDVGLSSDKEERLTWFSTTVSDTHFKGERQFSSVQLKIQNFPFMPGRYFLTLFCMVNGEIADWISNAFYFDVEPGDFHGSGRLSNPGWGYFLVNHQFTVQ